MAMTQRDSVSGMLKALEGIRVYVYKKDTTTIVDIFQRRSGASAGPAPETGATGGPNPFVTGPSGEIEFWCEGPAEFDVYIEDTIAPARIAARTMGWNAVTAADASIPTAKLALDASLPLGAMSPAVMRQMHQIGEVIDWWRPNATVPLPSGFEICDGHSVPAGQHDFAGMSAQAVNMPDLRNMFILGADSTKTHAAAAGQGNTAAEAPGIAGTGGSNAKKSLAHGHGIPAYDHTHNVGLPNHQHSGAGLAASDHSHAWGAWSGMSGGDTINRASGGAAFERTWNHQHYTGGQTGGATALGVGGYTAPGGAATVGSTGVVGGAAAQATNSTTWTGGDPGDDLRPRFIGLLKLMKVRYS
jgi:hypothetical protein